MSTSILLIIAYAINILSAISLIFIERKEPTTTWAWLLILLVLPGVGFIIYLLFGQNLNRQKIFREKKVTDEKKARDLLEKFREEILGNLVINIEDEDKEKVINYLKEKDIVLEVLN